MFASTYVFFLFTVILACKGDFNMKELECDGVAYHNVSLSAYYPEGIPEAEEYNDTSQYDHTDIQLEVLRPLMDFFENRTSFVSVAGNVNSGIDYGTKVCIEDLNKHFGKRIPLEIRDQIHGGRSDLLYPDYSRLEIYVRHLYEKNDIDKLFVNRPVTIHVKNTTVTN